MTRSFIFAVLSACLVLMPSQVMAKAEFNLSVPNTSANGGCLTCHTSTSAPIEWNDFGLDVQETAVDGQPSWAALCDLDSDGDGATNGLELADPECSWVAGDDDPAGDVTHPGDAESTPLGTDEPDTVDSPDDAGSSAPADTGSSSGPDTADEGTDTPETEGSSTSTTTDDGGGCQGGSSAPLAALGMLFALAMVLRRRFV